MATAEQEQYLGPILKASEAALVEHVGLTTRRSRDITRYETDRAVDTVAFNLNLCIVCVVLTTASPRMWWLSSEQSSGDCRETSGRERQCVPLP